MNSDRLEINGLFVLRFFDHPDRLGIRQQFMDAHLQWLADHREKILVAGSLRTDPADQPVGACWIVQADTKAKVEALLKTDPFWIHGLRASYEIHFWSKAFPDATTPV